MRVTTDSTQPQVQISVRQTERLSAFAKGHPERTAVEYIARAFDRIGLRYSITWDHPPIADVPDPNEDSSTTLQYWSSLIQGDDVEGLSKDSDILLTHQNGGGRAYIGAKAAIAPGGTLTEDYSHDLRDWVTPDDPRQPIYGILHELGHSLGSRHKVNWGQTWIDDDERGWYRTPCANAGTINLDGDEQPKRPTGYEKRNVLSYATGAQRHMDIK